MSFKIITDIVGFYNSLPKEKKFWFIVLIIYMTGMCCFWGYVIYYLITGLM